MKSSPDFANTDRVEFSIIHTPERTSCSERYNKK